MILWMLKTRSVERSLNLKSEILALIGPVRNLIRLKSQSF